MFVRIKSRKKRLTSDQRILGDLPNTDTYFQFLLCANHRVNGRIKQEHIATLGGITESAIVDGDTSKFFTELKKRLDNLANRITPTQREEFELFILLTIKEIQAKGTASQALAKAARAKQLQGMAETAKSMDRTQIKAERAETEARIRDARKAAYQSIQQLEDQQWSEDYGPLLKDLK